MMTKNRMISLLIAAVLFVALFAGCGAGGDSASTSDAASATASTAEASGESASTETLLIKVAHGATEDHSSHIGWLKFKEIIETESNGSMKVEIYPNQQLGGDREVVEGTQLGNITAGHSSGSPIAAFAKEFYVLDAPFMFNSREEVYSVLDGDPGQKLLSYFEGIGLKGLGYTENGFRNLTANKLVTSPADLSGMKIRVMENTVQMLTWSSMGANPTPIAFGELFTALQQKTVDAQENPFELIYTNKFYEVQDYVIVTNHIYTPLIMFMNLDFYNAMTPEQQAIVDQAAKECIAVQRETAQANETNAIESIKDSIEIVELTEEQKQSFKDMMAPVYDEVRNQVQNDELVDLFIK